MLLWIAAAAALAQDALTFTAVRVVEHGKAHPSITFTPGVDGSLEATLTCGATPFRLAAPLRRGSPVTLTLAGLPSGPWDCAGQVVLQDSAGGVGSMPLNLQVASLEPIGWTYGLEDVDLPGKRLVTHPTRPIRDAVLQVLSVGGAQVDTARADVADPSNPVFTWSSGEEVVKLVVEAEDGFGLRSRLELSPWSYAIPHEDVVFASGRHDLDAAELPKLDATWVDTQQVLAKYGPVVEIQLYVAGYTDTVGNPAANQALSERRARAIAQWFRQQGFSGPIWYQGFGEAAPAISTPDEVAEVANRRALYVLAAQTPPTTPDLPKSEWKRL